MEHFTLYLKSLNYFTRLLYKSPKSAVRQNYEEIFLEKQLMEIDPATLQCLEQLLAENLPAFRSNISKTSASVLPGFPNTSVWKSR